MVTKRKESHLLTACLEYLQIMENSKRIVHYDRLNSGMIFNKGRKIQLCRSGTPDAFVILNGGKTLWIETKVNDAVLAENQLNFYYKISRLANHFYLLITEINQLIFFLDNPIKLELKKQLIKHKRKIEKQWRKDIKFEQPESWCVWDQGEK